MKSEKKIKKSKVKKKLKIIKTEIKPVMQSTLQEFFQNWRERLKGDIKT